MFEMFNLLSDIFNLIVFELDEILKIKYYLFNVFIVLFEFDGFEVGLIIIESNLDGSNLFLKLFCYLVGFELNKEFLVFIVIFLIRINFGYFTWIK